MALDQAAHKPLSWFCYVDDTFIIWQHRPHWLRDYLDQLNSVHQNIQFKVLSLNITRNVEP
jgi:hypothetical protein